MKKLLLLSASFLILSFSPANAQVKEGEITIGGINVDIGYSILQTKDGGYAIGGYTASYGPGYGSVYLIKLDSALKLQWTKTIGGGAEWGNCMIQTKDGGFAIAGFTEAYGLGYSNIYVVKLDSAGNLQWTRAIGGTKNDQANSIVQTRDGGYAITGFTTSFGDTISEDVYVIKLDAAGNLQWTKTIGGAKADWGNSIIQTLDDGYIIAGCTYSFADTTNGDVYVIKLDSTGTVKWTKTIGGNGIDVGYSIIQSKDKDYVIAGWTTSFSVGANDEYVIKLDTSGNIQWTRTIYGTSANSIIQTKDNGYCTIGSTGIYGGGYLYMYLAKLDSAGNLKWSNTFGDINSDIGYSLAETSDKGFAVTGENYSIGIGASNVMVFKTDSIGNTCLGVVRDSGRIGSGGTITANDSGRVGNGGTITAKDSGQVSAGGSIIDNCGIASVNNIAAIENSETLFPNPNNGRFTIELQGVRDKEQVEIYNMLGEKIYEETLRPAQGDNAIDLGSKASGVYMYRLINETGEQIADGKFIIQ